MNHLRGTRENKEYLQRLMVWRTEKECFLLIQYIFVDVWWLVLENRMSYIGLGSCHAVWWSWMAELVIYVGPTRLLLPITSIYSKEEEMIFSKERWIFPNAMELEDLKGGPQKRYYFRYKCYLVFVWLSRAVWAGINEIRHRPIFQSTTLIVLINASILKILLKKLIGFKNIYI